MKKIIVLLTVTFLTVTSFVKAGAVVKPAVYTTTIDNLTGAPGKLMGKPGEDITPVINAQMVALVDAMRETYTGQSFDEWYKAVGVLNSDHPEVRNVFNKIYEYESEKADAKKIIAGDNSSLRTLVETIIKGGTTGPTYPPPPPGSETGKAKWWQVLFNDILNVACFVGASYIGGTWTWVNFFDLP